MTHSFNILALAGLLTALTTTIGSAQGGLPLSDLAYAPEGISHDASGNLYVGSLTQGRIVKFAAGSRQLTEFAPAGANGMVTILGVHVQGDQVFACSSDPGFGVLAGTAAPALVAFDVKTGKAAGRYPLPEGGILCNDIAALPDGTLLATDSFAPRIYALKPGADHLDVWFEDDQFGGEGFNLNGIAYDDGAVYVARYNSGTLHKIPVGAEGQAGPAKEIDLGRQVVGADGLTALGQGRFLLVEGGGLQKDARGALLGVTVTGNAGVLVNIAPELNVPTTATVIGDTAYVVEGQLDHLFDPNAGPADPYRILEIKLPEAFQ
ncbi:hypothetical protein [Parasphingorhabdus sp.]|uniref:SMP-30/gluconolactonase/LRE family protein n=1 Tax=Parasphingorhabdus sp. TaxID=2709688 RepID=UPI003298B017